jgi:hypothetical protein
VQSEEHMTQRETDPELSAADGPRALPPGE